MLKELLRIAAAALGAALVQVADLVQHGGVVSLAIAGKIVVGTVLVRVAMWVISKFGPAPQPAA